MTGTTTEQQRHESPRVDAPWSPEQVEALNLCQNSGIFQTFTSENGNPLIATSEGWVEQEGGDIIQTWAYLFMTSEEAIREKKQEIFGPGLELEEELLLPKLLPEAAEAYERARQVYPFEHTFIEEVNFNSPQPSVDLGAVKVWLEENIGSDEEGWVCMGGDPAGVAYQYRFKNESDLERFKEEFGECVL